MRPKEVLRAAPVLVPATSVLCTVSVGMLFLAAHLGLASTSDPDVPGYLQKTNWSLRPLFWPILALLVHHGWRTYVRAWQGLPTREVVFRNGVLETSPDSLTFVVDRLSALRPLALGLAVLLGMGLSAVDAGCLWAEYGVIGAARAACSETDFTIAFRLDAFAGIDRSANGWFVLAGYVMQGGLASYALFALMQLLLQSSYFLSFEKRPLVAPRGLAIRLNYRDPLREFGLGQVNRAINTTYVFIALGMALPVLSAFWNPAPDFGQWTLRVLLPLIVLFPAGIPIFERVSRVAEAADRMRKDPDPGAPDDYAKQRLWPFDQTQIGYVGKTAAGLAFAEYGYLITRNISDLL